MWVDIIIALVCALNGTYFGTCFLAKREEKKVKKDEEMIYYPESCLTPYSWGEESY